MPRSLTTHIDSPKAVGQRLRQAREAMGLSQRQLAFPGCTAAYISRLEAGARVPSLQMIEQLALRVHKDMRWLATGVEPEPEPEPNWDNVVPLVKSGTGMMWAHLKLFADGEETYQGAIVNELGNYAGELWDDAAQDKAANLVPPSERVETSECSTSATFEAGELRLEITLYAEFEGEAITELQVAHAARQLVGPLAAKFYDLWSKHVWGEKLQTARNEAEARQRQSQAILDILPVE